MKCTTAGASPPEHKGRPAGQVGVRDALLPDLGHRGLPHGPRQRVRQRRDRPDARGLRHREVAVGHGLPLRQRRRRVDQQDTEGRARPPRDVRHDARAPGQTLGLRALVQQFQDPLDAGLHVAGRVQGGGAVPPGIVQIGVANPTASLIISRGYLGFFDWGGCYVAESLRDEDCISKAHDVHMVTHIFSRQNDKKLYDSLV